MPLLQISKRYSHPNRLAKRASRLRLLRRKVARSGLRPRSRFQVPGSRSGLEFGIWDLGFQPVCRLWSSGCQLSFTTKFDLTA